MSRLNRPFYKPIHDLPRPVHPLSPPETDITTDSFVMNIGNREPSYTDLTSSPYTKVEPHEAHPAPPSEAPSGRYRRSNLSYVHNNSFRGESRSAPRSAARWLVMVSPPPAISREHSRGLYLNASAHSSQAILIPLFPSFSSQLAAIAREFCFPSTTGISIYLQMGDAGLQYAPRVSEESWPILWGNTLEEKQGANGFGGLPIAGRIEFDLDLRKARWFDMWVMACRKDIDISTPGPSFIARHGREASSSTYEPADESIADDVSVTIKQKVPIIRHIPRKLSLLDRADISSLKLAPPQTVLSPAEEATMPTSPTGPAPQLSDEERETSIQRVEKKVQNWRASSSFAKSPLVASTGQTALDPANMPNNFPLSDVVTEASPDGPYPLNFDDFQWSITSAGPSATSQAFDIDAYSDWSRVQSVHLDKRLAGSVCLTPTTCTSFGPPEYEIVSPTSVTYRLPSPDIAARHIYSPPLTPATATSWGAPSEWPESPAYSYRAPSVDIAARHLESRPVTPSTATSWGAPLEWPDSPLMHSALPTPGLGFMFLGEDDELVVKGTSRPPQSTSSGVWRHVWPYNSQESEANLAHPWKQVWPYNDRHLSKKTQRQDKNVEFDMGVGSTGCAYPIILLYPPVYPYFDLYPKKLSVHVARRAISTQLEAKYPTISLYKAAYPSFEIYPGHVVEPQESSLNFLSVKLSASYPAFEIYTPIYPNVVIYPPTSVRVYDFQDASSVYPNLVIYPPVIAQGQKLREPARTTERVWTQETAVITKLDCCYPVFDLYPAAYPYNLGSIYPSQGVLHESEGQHLLEIASATRYPYFDIYPAVYPFFDIYPAVRREEPVKFRAAVSLKNRQDDSRALVSVALKPGYPVIELYPPGYPHLDIYPATVVVAYDEPNSIICSAKYPNIDIYPAVYPYFDLYRSGSASLAEVKEGHSVYLKASYPNFNIYAAVYPYFDIYSSGISSIAENTVSKVELQPAYPSFDIYPAVYPYFDIYKSGCPSTPEVSVAPTIAAKATYPFFDLYPAVYPYFDIYSSGYPSKAENNAPPTSLKAIYPFFDLYPAEYPYFDIYCSGFPSTPRNNDGPAVVLNALYPFFDLYPAAYPYLQLYPTLQGCIQPSVRSLRKRKTHRELAEIVLAESRQSAYQPRRPRKTHQELCAIVCARETISPPPSHPVQMDRQSPSSRSNHGLATVPEDSLASDEAQIPDTQQMLKSLKSRLDVTFSQESQPSRMQRSTSLRQAPAVPESNGFSRSLSLRGPRAQMPRTLNRDNDPTVKSTNRRDSIVLEKARHWGSKSGHQPTSSVASIDDTLMSEFPMPPSIPLSHALPSGIPLHPSEKRVSKLDKSKYPFH